MRKRRAAERDARADTATDESLRYASHADAEHVDWPPRLDDVIDDLAGEYGEPLPIIIDRMPPGANSHAGSDEGSSNGWHYPYRAVAGHPWFAANPHWAYALNDPDEAALYLDSAA